MTRRRTFGTTRRLPSGRYQARTWVDGEQVPLGETFETKKAAESALSAKQLEMERGVRVHPKSGKQTVRSYSVEWMTDRSIADPDPGGVPGAPGPPHPSHLR
jgi:hypothetical protein